MRSRSRLVAVVIALLVGAPLVGTPAPAWSEDVPPESQAETLAAEGRRLFSEGNFAGAINAYLKAHQISQAAEILYNVAFIYDKKLNEAELAMTYYRRYIGSPDADPDVVQRATARLNELKQAPPKKPPEPQPVPRDGRPQQIAGWTVLGIGGAALVAGVALVVVAKKDADTFHDTGASTGDRQTARDRGKTLAIAGDVLWSVGAAAVVTGLVVALTAPKGGQGKVSVSGAPLPGGGLVSLGGAF